MPDNQRMASDPAQQKCTPATRVILARVLILFGLFAWAFWPELWYIGRTAARDSDWAHGLVIPIGVLLLVLRRRRELTATPTGGSSWGIALLLLGFVLYAVFTWPCCFGYPRRAAIIVVAAGIVLAVCGWSVLKRCVPMLLLLLLSIPIGARAYAALIIRPETVTLSATRLVLDQLPGVDVTLDGPDLSFVRGDQCGMFALGESNRGAALLATYAAIGVFVVFARIRPFWQVALMAAAAGPIALLCNIFRLVCWGIVAIYLPTEPVSPVPRAAAAVASLLVAYALFALGCWVLSRLIVELDEDDDTAECLSAADG
jgi:exosortase